MFKRLAPAGLLVLLIGIGWGGYQIASHSHSRAEAEAEHMEMSLGEPSSIMLLALMGVIVVAVLCVAGQLIMRRRSVS